MADDPLLMWVRGHLIGLMDSRNPDAPRLLEAGLTGFRARGDRYYTALALRWFAFYYLTLGDDYAELFTSTNEQYLALTREIGDLTGMAHALYYKGEAAFHAWQLDDAVRYFHEAQAIWQKMGDLKSVMVTKLHLGDIAFHRAELEQAKPLLEEAARLASDLKCDCQDIALDTLRVIACIEGDHETGKPTFVTNTYDNSLCLGPLFSACAQGDFPLVCDHLRTVLHWNIAHPAITDHVVKLLPMAAMLLAHEGRSEWAVELLARQASERVVPVGYFEHWALLDEARTNLEQRLGTAAFDAAWQRGETLDVATTAYRLLAYLGDESATAQTQANQSLLDPLTDREYEILQLVATGQTNTEIADTLVISHSTVRWHLHNVCSKLIATNRTHAVARARELNILL